MRPHPVPQPQDGIGEAPERVLEAIEQTLDQ
jgi:hypothetical protein